MYIFLYLEINVSKLVLPTSIARIFNLKFLNNYCVETIYAKHTTLIESNAGQLLYK
jgi:hypothetical protein